MSDDLEDTLHDTAPHAILPEGAQPYFKRIDHLGIAVPSLEAALPLYRTLFGKEVEHIEEVPDQKVRTAFFSLGESHFELLEPIGDDGPIAKYLSKHRGGMHHVCVEVTDIEAVLAAYKAAGIVLIDEVPRPGANGMRVAFVHPKSTGGVLLELSEPAR